MKYDSETFEAIHEAAERAATAWKAYEEAQQRADGLKLDALATARHYAELTGSRINSRERTRNRKMTPTFLTEIASVYRTAVEAGSHPTQAVADAYGVAYSSASRWVLTARSEGLLPKTRQGVISA